MANLEVEPAFRRHDVERGSTVHGTHVHGGVGNIVVFVERPAVLPALGHLLQEGDEGGGVLHRIHTGRGER